MSTQVTTLANGLRVVTHTMEHLETTSLGVWVGTGARHEEPAEHGISHFLEHMAFKGTATRTARQIAETIEEVGGELNAATSLESTAYYARVLGGDDGLALELLSDILRNANYGEEETEREREVILQEIAAIRDSPEELAFDLLQDVAFPNQPVGRPVIGTPESVSSFTPASLRSFLNRRYTGPDMIVAAAGAVDHARFVGHAEQLFGGIAGSSSPAAVPARWAGGVRASEKPFEQSHLVIGFEQPSYRDPAFFTVQVFSALLGGGMSSRLFQEVREERGLCYSIYSSAWSLTDTGMFSIHAATGPEEMGELISVVADEVRAVADSGVSAAEVSRAKAQMKAGLLMGLESSGARTEQMARHLMGHGRVISTREIVDRIDAVTGAGVQAVASRMLSAMPPAVAVVGAGAQSIDYAEDAAGRLGSSATGREGLPWPS
jgi:predicted Zn-dependent peptidase